MLFRSRRKPGTSRHTTQRREADEVQILSGVFEGKTTGTPIGLLIQNIDQRSKDYSDIKDSFRPGHADYTYQQKYGFRDYRGGGRSSARETAMRVAAGSIAKKYLQACYGITVRGYLAQLGPIKAEAFDWDEVENNPFFCPDSAKVTEMEAYMDALRKEGNSIGARINVIASGLFPGLGEPVFDRLDAEIAHALVSINAVKGVEIGAGFSAAEMLGSQCNDAFVRKEGRTTTRTNNAGGILGGISNGADIVIRLVVKPTSSINLEQDTVTRQGKKSRIRVEGRHDPCICPRAVPIAESMVALTLVNH